ncbi:hypothetical protein JNB_00340 [Janibacter sp. HTCC2649]|uniref:hypothetical protein n=1 Tax=Janibacter sp. HTCC2649 TaxID=313589 RepID=UPI000066EB1E|nr:hypothetical protein [Janibacter sp. HTCC2649]EAP98570.1 hypothetical protein JNB_00340 [Janibacter sp. HTCC2649]
MIIPTTRLGQAAGIALAVAGAIFVAVQIKHPPMDLASLNTTDWFVRNTAKTVMSALALAGITGVYLRQRSRVGVWGLVGYLTLTIGYFMLFATTAIAAFVLPSIATTSPDYAIDVVNVAFGGKAVGDIGAMGPWLNAIGVFYILGGLVFGLTTYRAGVLAKWAAALLAIGNTATIALAVLPDSYNRPFAVPTGIALIGLGVSLFRDQSARGGERADEAADPAHLVAAR